MVPSTQKKQWSHPANLLLGMASFAVTLLFYQIIYAATFTSIGNALVNKIDIINECTRRPSNNGHGGMDYADQVTDAKIPNIIHQIWKTTDLTSYGSDSYHEYWKAMFEPRGYAVKLWTEAEIQSLIHTHYAWLEPTYLGYSQNIQRADLARLIVVHAFGGMYADLDVYPFDEQTLECLQHRGYRGMFATARGNAGISNHWFMASSGADFLQDALEEAHMRGSSGWFLLPYLRVFWSTGPWMLGSTLQKYISQHVGAERTLALLDDAFSRYVFHHGAGRSWHCMDGKILNAANDHSAALRVLGVVLLAAVMTFAGMKYAQRRQKQNTWDDWDWKKEDEGVSLIYDASETQSAYYAQ